MDRRLLIAPVLVLACAAQLQAQTPAPRGVRVETVQPASSGGEAGASQTGKDRAELVLDTQGFTGHVNGLAFSPDGKLLAVAGGKEVRIWNIETGQLVRTLRGQRTKGLNGFCHAVAFSPDSRELLVGINDFSEDGSIRIYDMADLTEIRRLLPGHRAPVRKLAFSRDGKYLASLGENGNMILWQGSDHGFAAIVPPQDPKQMVFGYLGFPGTEPYLLLHQASGMGVISVPSGKRLTPQNWIPDSLRAWLAPRQPYQYPFNGSASALDLKLERGLWLAGGTGKREGKDVFWVGVWRAGNASPSQVYLAHKYTITAVALNPAATLAASADSLGDVHVWEPDTGRTRHIFHALGQPIYRVAFGQPSNVLAFGTTPFPTGRWTYNNFAEPERTWHFDTRKLTERAEGNWALETAEQNGRRLGVSMCGGAYCLSFNQAGRSYQPFKVRAGAAPTCFTFLRSPKLGLEAPVVFGDDGGALLCYNPFDQERRREFIGHDSFVTSVSQSPDGRFLASASTDRTIRIWSLERYRPMGDWDFDYLSDTVTRVKPGTSAAQAGIQVGDRVLAMDGHDLTDLENMVLEDRYHFVPGQRVGLRMKRGEQTFDVQVVLKEGFDYAQPLLSLFFANEHDWIVWTPQGYYDASPGGDRLIGWHVNQGPARSAKFYPVHQFRKQLYRPDIIDLVLQLGNVPEAIEKANAALPRPTAPVDLRDTVTLQQIEPPRVHILEPADGAQTTDGKIEIRADVQSPNDLPVDKVTLLVNGRPQPVKPLSPDERRTARQQTLLEQISLLPGLNQIALLASNGRADSAPTTINVTYNAADQTSAKPDLYVLSIGISEYAKPQYNLRFAHKDAQDFVEAWQKQKGAVYRNVETRLLRNQEASVQGILAGMDWLVKNVTQRDVAVIFLSAHGVRDERRNYYLASYDLDPHNLRSTGVRFNEVKELLRDLPCKVLVFADTCHSGGITGEKATFVDDPLRDLVSEEYGAVVFCSSLPREVSLEDPTWGHGAFTKALIDTFNSPDSDNNHDGYLSIVEVEDHVDRRVKELTQGRQHSVVDRPPTIPNFSFYRLLAGSS
jgi:WD40 repeat protein